MEHVCPLAVHRCLNRVSRDTNNFSYLKLDSCHRVVESGGDLASFGLDSDLLHEKLVPYRK